MNPCKKLHGFFFYHFHSIYISIKRIIMDLYTIVNKLKDIALTIPNVNSVYDGDIYSLNAKPNVKYGTFFVTQSNHSQTVDSSTFTLTLYYIDRAFQDNSTDLEIHSTGLKVLQSIINKFVYSTDCVVEDEINYTTWIHKFSDYCAGVFCTINVTTNNDVDLCD